ncbi:MAG: glycosyltransferase [Candidatus Omnitrophica bacterium]|nr:glycosyltransferase [Candidatus Omnitrophota bacterium]
MIVKNEEQWVWYALASVIQDATQLFIYDTGSKDKTVEIIKTFPQNKIIFEQKGEVTQKQLVELRQEQLLRTKTSWFLLLDGDEVWPKNTLIKFQQKIFHADKKKVGVVFKTRVCLGDIFHYQEEEAGRYEIGGHKGHLNIRGYKKTKNYRWHGIYPNEVYVDEYGVPLQDSKDKLIFVNDYYWHLTHLQRSSVTKNPKRKLEIGFEVNPHTIPEVFYHKKPAIVPSPWIKYSSSEYIIASILTPIRKIKRKFFS